jgi:hypothetical protein
MRRLLLVLVMIAGCTGSSNYWITYSPPHGSTSLQKGPAVQAAVVAITDVGKEVESSDAASGLVLSKWFSSDGFGGAGSRFRVRVAIGETGSYDIVALCQSKDPMTSAWRDCEEQGKRPRFVAEVLTAVEMSLRSASAKAPPAAATPAVAAPRGFYCASSCAREKSACDQSRIASSDTCTLVESAFCFGLRAGGEVCSPSLDACTEKHGGAGESVGSDCTERR